ncbi:unnamed protein product [Rhizoctonia solani]|uniref:Uncharacterized protein n=2 Tax=Rhizoctonia solani TaxID=456999 RepID=A0A8H3GFB9_9AGAM
MSDSEDIASIINEAREDMKRAHERVQKISKRQAPLTVTSTEGEAIDGLLTEMGNMKSLIVVTTKSIKEWTGKKGKGKRALPKQGFTVTQTAKNINAEIEERTAIGNAGFNEDLAKAMKDPKYSISAWYEGISEASAPNMFVDATYGLFCVAAGIEELPLEEMNVALASVLTDTLEAEVLQSFEKTRVGDIQPEHLYRFFEEAHTTSNAVNRRPRVILLQHIVLAIHSLKAALGWSRLEKGDGENGKKRIVREAYASHCKAKGLPLDYDLPAFRTFAKKIKDYNTGISRFLQAYIQLGSILLLLPQLGAQRFISPQLGPRLKEAVARLDEESRERVHRAILQGVIVILGSEKQDLAGALKDIDEAILTAERPKKRARIGD